MDSSSADHRGTGTARRVLPGIVGGGVAVLMWAAMTYMPIAAIALSIGVAAVVVIALRWRGTAGTSVVRWWARTAGVIGGALMAMIVLGDVVGGHGPPMNSVVGVAILASWAAIFLGVVAAFFWEGAAGAVLILAALALQAPVLGGWLNPYVAVFAVVGVAFLFCWWRTRRRSAARDPQSEHITTS